MVVWVAGFRHVGGEIGAATRGFSGLIGREKWEMENGVVDGR